MLIQDILKENTKKLDRQINIILKLWQKEVSSVSSDLTSLVGEFIKANKGGKKIRGFLVRLGYELAGGRDRESILTAAAAYEIFHTSILAHDDIIDKSPTRRGRPSLYKSVGVEQAITLADAGFFLAMKIISESKFEEKLKNQALKMFSKTMIDTAIGQMLDIAHGDPQTVALLKTARYTIAGPLILGAILAGLGPTSRLLRRSGYEGRARLREVKGFGENLGIAFQIRDDILDGEVESVEEAETKALQYTDKARMLIPKLTDDAKIRKLLQGLADYLVERRK